MKEGIHQMCYTCDRTNGKAMIIILNVDVLYYHERAVRKGCYFRRHYCHRFRIIMF